VLGSGQMINRKLFKNCPGICRLLGGVTKTPPKLTSAWGQVLAAARRRVVLCATRTENPNSCTISPVDNFYC
jgi:hypothetical protein